jgi:hypothetical protein
MRPAARDCPFGEDEALATSPSGHAGAALSTQSWSAGRVAGRPEVSLPTHDFVPLADHCISDLTLESECMTMHLHEGPLDEPTRIEDPAGHGRCPHTDFTHRRRRWALSGM